MVNDHRRSSNRRPNSPRSKGGGKNVWTSICDTVFFNPQSDSTNLWRDMYKLNRQVKEIERGLYQPVDESWLGRLKSGAVSAWHDLVDETKAVLTALAFHLLTLVLIVACNVIFFGGLFWLLGRWLGG
jgi:hypothetical protein